MTSPSDKQLLKTQARQARREKRRKSRKKALRWGLYILAGYFGLVIILAIAGFDPKKNALSDEECAKTLQCLADKHAIDAIVACQPIIERKANFDFKWTDGMTSGPKFDLYKWANKDKGIITYAGDKIKFQNGFGAWSPMKYVCNFDTNTGKALQATAAPGRW